MGINISRRKGYTNIFSRYHVARGNAYLNIIHDKTYLSDKPPVCIPTQSVETREGLLTLTAKV